MTYLSIAEEAISSALVQEDGKHQRPIYFVSRVLHDAEKWYQMIEKVALLVITSVERLRSYF